MSIRQHLRTAVKMAEMANERRKRWAAPLKPPACPPGWRIDPPDFVGVGVKKGGTTWWSRAVFAHPDILAPVKKELRFFQHHWDEEFTEQGVVEYHRYFPRPDGGKATGEWTPNYMFDPWTARRLQRAAPDARILVIPRYPWPDCFQGFAIRRTTTTATLIRVWSVRPSNSAAMASSCSA